MVGQCPAGKANSCCASAATNSVFLIAGSAVAVRAATSTVTRLSRDRSISIPPSRSDVVILAMATRAHGDAQSTCARELHRLYHIGIRRRCNDDVGEPLWNALLPDHAASRTGRGVCQSLFSQGNLILP